MDWPTFRYRRINIDTRERGWKNLPVSHFSSVSTYRRSSCGHKWLVVNTAVLSTTTLWLWWSAGRIPSWLVEYRGWYANASQWHTAVVVVIISATGWSTRIWRTAVYRPCSSRRTGNIHSETGTAKDHSTISSFTWWHFNLISCIIYISLISTFILRCNTLYPSLFHGTHNYSVQALTLLHGATTL